MQSVLAEAITWSPHQGRNARSQPELRGSPDPTPPYNDLVDWRFPTMCTRLRQDRRQSRTTRVCNGSTPLWPNPSSLAC